ncbi:hypothetical protein LMG10661_03748 [Ralstonia syzygii subsp. syzygii]|nr:hypothetical protein LMG10661_03748 [Ralstonia syzygii subsp. syzygii]
MIVSSHMDNILDDRYGCSTKHSRRRRTRHPNKKRKKKGRRN